METLTFRFGPFHDPRLVFLSLHFGAGFLLLLNSHGFPPALLVGTVFTVGPLGAAAGALRFRIRLTETTIEIRNWHTYVVELDDPTATFFFPAGRIPVLGPSWTFWFSSGDSLPRRAWATQSPGHPVLQHRWANKRAKAKLVELEHSLAARSNGPAFLPVTADNIYQLNRRNYTALGQSNNELPSSRP